MQEHESFLRYARFRHLKLAFVGLAAATALYVWEAPGGRRDGGTDVGLALGIISAALILWLAWLGVRKRRHGLAGARLTGWVSAHVYLGLTLLVLVPLHSGFQFGENVHTLAYALMVLVIASGAVGVWLYATLPQRVSDNRAGLKLDDLLRDLAALDGRCAELARGVCDEVADAVGAALAEPIADRSLLSQLAHSRAGTATTAAIELLGRPGNGAQHDAAVALVDALSRRRRLLERARADIRYQALLRAWLLVHVPVSCALLAALTIHVFAVFYYR